MIVRRLVLIGVGAAVILGGTAVVLDQVAQTPQAPSSSGLIPNAGDGSQGSDGSPDSSDPDSSNPGADGGTETPSDKSPGLPDAERSPEPRVLEVLPPATAAPTGLPMPAPAAALIRAPMPASGSAQGRIVDGFPENVVTFPDGTVLVSTSVSSVDLTLQLTADGIVGLSTEQVLGHFQQSLLDLGFQSEAAPASDGQRSLRLWRGSDTVTVSTTTTGTGSTRFTLLGTLHA